MKYKLNPFEENVKEFDVYKLAEWINRCKKMYQPNKQGDPDYAETLPQNIRRFTDEWLEHQRKNKDFYESDLYRRALIASNYKRPRIFIKCKKQKFDVSDIIYENNFSFIANLPTKDHKEFEDVLKNNMVDTIDDYLELVDDIFSHPDEYKKYIDIFLKELHRKFDITFNLKELSNSFDINGLKKDELVDLLNNAKRVGGKPFIVKGGYSSFVEMFDDYEISKSTYFDWKTPSREQRDYDKKFVVCLGLMLGLPLNEFETLMSYNGFCLAGSLREFDKIVLQGVVCGFPYYYINEIMRKANDELVDKFKVANASKIPLLERSKR